MDSSGPGHGLPRPEGPKPYKFIGVGDIHGPKPYKFIGFGDSRRAPGRNPYQGIRNRREIRQEGRP